MIIKRQSFPIPSAGIFYLEYEYGISIKKTIEESKDIRKALVELIHKDSDRLLRVVKVHFPAHLELLEKLLILK